jgi:4-hydroxy-3-polyprenylbenzoate decarboxylase
MRRVVVGISGASGSIYGIRLLEQLRSDPGVEVHLVVSASGKRTLVEETPYTLRQVESLAHVVYDDRDVGASIASGSFRTDCMIVAPCSIKTLAALATCHADTLIARAGDVTLKEGRPLLALVRETPLHVGHLRQMLAFAEMGGIVFPPVPAFYRKPQTVEELVTHTVARVLERLGLAHEPIPEWTAGGRTPSAG